jgi:hypothetical protein
MYETGRRHELYSVDANASFGQASNGHYLVERSESYYSGHTTPIFLHAVVTHPGTCIQWLVDKSLM